MDYDILQHLNLEVSRGMLSQEFILIILKIISSVLFQDDNHTVINIH